MPSNKRYKKGLPTLSTHHFKMKTCPLVSFVAFAVIRYVFLHFWDRVMMPCHLFQLCISDDGWSWTSWRCQFSHLRQFLGRLLPGQSQGLLGLLETCCDERRSNEFFSKNQLMMMEENDNDKHKSFMQLYYNDWLLLQSMKEVRVPEGSLWPPQSRQELLRRTDWVHSSPSTT